MSHRILIAAAIVAAATAALWFSLTADDASRYLVFSTWGTPAEIGSFQRLIDRYNATRHPEHPVKLSHSEQYQYTERLLVGAAARSFPDVIHLDRGNIPLFAAKGLIEDLTPALARDTGFSTRDFLPTLLPSCMIGDRTFALPHNFSTLVLYYNRDHFDAEGIPYPDSTWTWETLVAVARRLTKTDANGTIVRYGCHLQIIYSTLIEQNGGRILNASLDSCVIGSPEAAGAIQFAVDLSEKYHVSWNMLAQNLLWDDMMAGGRLSMIANGRWAAAWYMRSLPPGVLDVAPLPRGKLKKGAATVHVMCIGAMSARKQEAWEFLKYLVSEEGQRMVNEDGASIPAFAPIARSGEFLRHHTTPSMSNHVFLDELPSSVVWPYEQGPHISAYTLQSQLELAVGRVLLGRATVAQSLKAMEAEVNRIIRAQRDVPVPRPFIGSAAFFLSAGMLILAPVALLAYRRRTRPLPAVRDRGPRPHERAGENHPA